MKKIIVLSLILSLFIAQTPVLAATRETPDQKRIGALEKELKSLSDQLKQLIQMVQMQNAQIASLQSPKTIVDTSNVITASDIAPYTQGVGMVMCMDPYNNMFSGTGELFTGASGANQILTNLHVIRGMVSCGVSFYNDNDGSLIGSYKLDVSQYNYWNTEADEAIVTVLYPMDASYPDISTISHAFSTLRSCSATTPTNSPVELIGYPASTRIGYTLNKTITNGIVSGYDNSPKTGGLPYQNYFVSAKIDHGNSGGLAVSKDSYGICFLGIPTWLNQGQSDSEGIVQNEGNIFYKQ